MHNLYVHEMIKIEQTEARHQARHARIVGLAVRANRAEPSSIESIQTQPSRSPNTNQAALKTAVSARR